MRAAQQKQSAEEGPEDERDRYVKGSVGILKADHRQRCDVEELGHLPEEAGDDGCRQHRARRHLAVGQQPVDGEENQHAGHHAKGLHGHVLHGPVQAADNFHQEERDGSRAKVIAQPSLRGMSRSPNTGSGAHTQHGQHATTEGHAERDHLVHQVITRLESPHRVQRNFERLKDAGAADEEHDDGDDFDLVRAGHGADLANNERLIAGQVGLHHAIHRFHHGWRVEYALADGEHEHRSWEEREHGAGCHAEGIGMHLRGAEVLDRGPAIAAQGLQHGGAQAFQCFMTAWLCRRGYLLICHCSSHCSELRCV